MYSLDKYGETTEDLYARLEQLEARVIALKESRKLSVQDLCEKYSCTRQTINSWVKGGQLIKHTTESGRVYFNANEIPEKLKKYRL
jgi:hypothetical protein